MLDEDGTPNGQARASGFWPPIDFVPYRVVSLVPSLTETLFDLDLGDRLIGVTDYCVRPANSVELLPKLGGTKNPDIERIISLQPDLVLLSDEENRKVDAEALQDAGVPIGITGPRTVFDVLNLLWTLMQVFDHAVMVPRVREIERAYDYSLAASETQGRVRVFVPIWRDPWMTFSTDTYIHDLLWVCGAENVFGGRGRRDPLAAELGEGEPSGGSDPHVAGQAIRYPCITIEEIIQAQPEIILLPNEPYAFSETDLEFFLTLDVPASLHERVYLVDGSLLTWYGTRTAYALRDLPPLLAQELEE